MKMLSYTLVPVLSLLVLAASASAGVIPLQSICPSPEGGNVTLFTITETDALPGNFIRGKLYTVRLDFIPGRNSTTSRIKCGSVVLGSPKTVADWDACPELHEGCPMTAGKVSSYRLSVKVPQVPPGMYPLYCEFIDDQDVRQICVAGNARIVLW